MSKKAKDIKEAYKNLVLIVYRKKYLIPQRPFPSTPFYIDYANNSYKMNPKLKSSQLNNKKGFEQFHNEIRKNIQAKSQDYVKAKQEYQKKHALYLQKCKRYKETYLDTIMMLEKTRAFNYFVKQYYLKNKDKKQKTLSFIAQIWKKMDTNEKSKVKEEMMAQKEKFQREHSEFIANHLIPTSKQRSSFTIFLKNNQHQRKAGWYEEALEKYRSLTKEQKAQLTAQSKQYVIDAKKRLEDFLQRWDITQEQLKYIKKICDSYQKIVKSKTTIPQLEEPRKKQ